MAYDFFEESTRLLKKACELGDVDPNVQELLEAPARVVSFRIPLKMDDGSVRIFDAYRVRHQDALGVSGDGTRISADLDLREVKALAQIMSIKHAAGQIPAGGGKGGIAADPRALSRREYEALCRAYIRLLRPSGPAYDMPGADMGTDLQSMAWMLDEYESINGHHAPAAVHDKPPILGGSLGGYEATGRGVFDVFQEAALSAGLEISGIRVAIEGFGQVGSVAATMFQEAGCQIVGVSDSSGGIYAKDGIDVAALLDHKRSTGSVTGFPGAEMLDHAALFECECDVLVPAARQGVITSENAGRIQAKMVVEAANAPTTLDGDAILLERGILVVPDILANAGSVHVCQMERTQGLYDNYWDIETVNRLRHDRLVDAFRNALATAARHDVKSARLGAWIFAVKRIEEAVKLRGWC